MCFPRKDGSPPGGLPFQPPVEPAVCLLTVLIVVFGSISTQGPGISLNRAENISGLTSLDESAEENQWDMVEVIKRAQENNDMACKAALKHAGERIGRAIASSLINVYNPSMILLDGGIVRPSRGETVYVNEFLLEVLAQYARDSSLPAASQEVEISIGGLGDDAVGLGAVATVIDNDPWFTMPDEQARNLAKAY